MRVALSSLSGNRAIENPLFLPCYTEQRSFVVIYSLAQYWLTETTERDWFLEKITIPI